MLLLLGRQTPESCTVRADCATLEKASNTCLQDQRETGAKICVHAFHYTSKHVGVTSSRASRLRHSQTNRRTHPKYEVEDEEQVFDAFHAALHFAHPAYCFGARALRFHQNVCADVQARVRDVGQ